MRIQFGEMVVPGVPPGPGDGLPILDAGGARLASADDLAKLGGGAVSRYPTVLPYDSQRSYDREIRPLTLRTVTIGDERTSATFLLDLGGRLWSLEVDGRELLYRAEPLMIGNLALRNAWFAGGTEWNLGFTGHWPLTCAPVFAGVVDSMDGPVLRLWEYERLLGLVWRIDAVVRDGVLFVHPVVHNHTDAAVPVYWWSNTAVPETPGTRVVVPADDAWQFAYEGGLDLAPVPGAPDVTYPGRLDGAADHFFRVKGHPWIACVDETGRGLGQVSTPRLRGRKLFRWGRSAGGRRWQTWLAPQGRGYLEIQAGLAATQLEHLPLPAGETWEWTEAYGLVAPGKAAHGDWPSACDATSRALGAMLPPERLAAAGRLLCSHRDDPVRMTATASGWGALQVAAGMPADPATPFPRDTLEAAQEPWLNLLTDGSFGGVEMPQAVTGAPWRALLDRAEGSRERYHAGLAALAAGDAAEAREHFTRSLAERPSWQALRALARLTVAVAEAAALMEQAWALGSDDPLLIETLAMLLAAGRHDRVIEIIEGLDDATRELPRVRFAEAKAAVASGDSVRAAGLLDESTLQIPDLREGEDSLAALWTAYQAAAGSNDPLPAAYDFRMH